MVVCTVKDHGVAHDLLLFLDNGLDFFGIMGFVRSKNRVVVDANDCNLAGVLVREVRDQGCGFDARSAPVNKKSPPPQEEMKMWRFSRRK